MRKIDKIVLEDYLAVYFKMQKVHTTFEPAIPFLEIHPKEIKLQKKTYLHIHKILQMDHRLKSMKLSKKYRSKSLWP